MMERLHRVQPSQWEELLELGRETYRQTFEAGNPPEVLEAYLADAFTEENMRAELANPESEFYFIYDEVEERPIAYLKVNVGDAQSEDYGDEMLEVERIYVLIEAKGRGYGTLLMQAAEAIARDKGKRRMWLGVWEHNQDAIRFYEKFGFQRVGQHIFVMGDDPQTDYIMEKVLT